ncbi:MAG: cell division protein ZapD [Thiobacillus sp.]|nr:cell division protein ZapD [Thiobacillus sp.]
MIVYEYPLNERIRTWLRLEDLFDKATFFIQAGDTRSHHAGLLAIFELADVMTRPELRSDLIQELERQKLSLEPLRSNPAVDPDRLDCLLERIGGMLAELHGLTGKLGQHIRDNDWLSGIKSRTGIPGGACGFDLPGYHYWLNMPATARAADLSQWLAPLLPIRHGVELILELLRESGNQGHYVANGGMFQLMLGGRVVQLLRVGLAGEWPCVPEVSANKYAVNLRFVTVEKNQKPKTFDRDVPFELVFCSLIGCCVQPT